MLDESIIHNLGEIAGKGNLEIISGRVSILPQDKSKIGDIIQFAGNKGLKVLPVGKETKIVYDGLVSGDEIILKMDNLNRVKQIAAQDLYVILDAGYDLSQINKETRSFNLFFPFSQEGASGSVAGAVATGLEIEANGKKISIKDWVLSLEVIDAGGEILDVGANVFKSVAGYDLARFFVGSWGTLGVITEVGLRLAPSEGKKGYEPISMIPPKRKRLDKNSVDYNAILSLRLKEALDPKGVFLEL